MISGPVELRAVDTDCILKLRFGRPPPQKKKNPKTESQMFCKCIKCIGCNIDLSVPVSLGCL